MSRYRRNQLVALLSLLLLLQGMFPMQLHTQLVRDEQGILVEVCTINGLQTMALDLDASPSEHRDSHSNERSAAMALSDLVSEAAPDLFTIVVAQHPRIHEHINTVFGQKGLAFPQGLLPIRAPPYSPAII